MSKATFNKNNQGEVVSFFSVMNPEALQEALLERSKQAALAFGVELLEQEVEKLCGAAFARCSVPPIRHRFELKNPTYSTPLWRCPISRI